MYDARIGDVSPLKRPANQIKQPNTTWKWLPFLLVIFFSVYQLRWPFAFPDDLFNDREMKEFYHALYCRSNAIWQLTKSKISTFWNRKQQWLIHEL
jgi:hypothetical protein